MSELQQPAVPLYIPPPPYIPPHFLSPFIPPARPPPLQGDDTPLHMACGNDHAPVIALLLATPGVDPLAKDVVSLRGTQDRLSGLPALYHMT